jgi:hypothetical protein
MKKISFCFLIFIIQSAILFSQKPGNFKWLEGTWKINAGSGFIVESWLQVNDSVYRGKSMMVKGKDTIPQENLEIAIKEGAWYYISTVTGQNNNQPVRFKIIFQKGTEFISENPAHDFPQRIAYRRVKDQVFASIEGKQKDKYAKINFDFTVE